MMPALSFNPDAPPIATSNPVVVGAGDDVASVLCRLNSSIGNINDQSLIDPIASLWNRIRSSYAVVVADPSIPAQPIGLFDLKHALASLLNGQLQTDGPVSSVMRSLVVYRQNNLPELATIIEHLNQAADSWVIVVDERDRILGCLTLDIALLLQKSSQSRPQEAALELIQQLTEAISNADSFTDALTGVLQEICDWGDWAFGEVWVPNSNQTALQSGAVWYDRTSALSGFTGASRQVAFLPNQGLPGRVWVNQTPEWIEDVCQCSVQEFLRVNDAQAAGLHGGCGIPIASSDGVEAVLVFFSTQPRPADRLFLNLTHSIARQLGQLIRRRRLEEALHRSDRLNRAVLSAIADVIIRVDGEGRYLDILNPGRPIPLVTVPAAERHHYPDADCLPEPDAQRQRQAIATTLEMQTLTVYERCLQGAEDRRWECLTILPLSETEGLMIVRNITGRKLANLSLRTTESRYRAIVEGQKDLICRYQLDGSLTFANPAYCHYFQIDPDQVIGYSLHSLIPAKQWQELAFQLKQLTPECPTYISEQQVVLPDGQHRWQLWTDYAIFDDDGQLVEFQAVGHDITHQKQTEASLERSRWRYRGIVEDQTEMICRFLPNGQLSFANAAYRAFFNIASDRDDIQGIPVADNIFQYVHPDDLSFVWEKIGSLTPEAPVITYEHRVQRPDGTVYWQRWTDRAIYDDHNELLEIQSVGHDITDRKIAELKLQESQSMLQMFVKYTPAAVAMFDRDMHYLAVSDRWKQDYDLDDSPLVGRSHYDIFPEISKDWKDIHQQSLAGAVISREQDPFPRRDGSIDYVRWEVRPWHSATGDVGGIIMFTEVITDRMQTQLELKRLADRLEVALTSGAIGIWEWDVVSNSLTWDERMFQLYDIPPDTPITYGTWAERIHPDDRAQAEQSIQQGLRAPYPHDRDFDTEFRILLTNGKVRHIRAAAKTMRNAQGEATQMIGINFDITKRRQAQLQIQIQNEALRQSNAKLEQATRMKDEFLAGMSHELRTPLNAILGLSEGLQEEVFGNLTPRQKQTIATIERSGRHLLELINDILDVSKIESGQFELHYTPVSLRSLCESSLALVRSQADRKAIQLSYRIATQITSLSADERRLHQILINLLSNAVKFTPNGGRVSLKVYAEQGGDRPMLVFAVQDTGIGIAETDLPKLFQMFVQIDSRLNRQHAGTGLGLALVKRLAELHGGSVAVESTVGSGSCFTVRIPCHSGPVPDATAFSSGIIRDANHPVMLIEDSASAAEQLSRYLHELGLQVHWFECGNEAIATTVDTQPAFIILDIQLPILSGWDVLRQLKNNPATQHIPVIIISVVDEQEPAKALGAADYLVKPITRSQLQAAIQRLKSPSSDPSSPGIASVEAAMLIAPAAPPASFLATQSATILIAEDNQANVDTIADYLTMQGYSLIMAHNGEEAIARTCEVCPDLILMDIQMPVMDGLTAIRHIRTTLAQTVPIIAMTALAMPNDRDRCLVAGATEYLSKPIRLRLLADTIHHLLSSSPDS